MFREVIKQYRDDKARVFITLTSGKYVTGVIVNHGPEALLVQEKDGTSRLVMKQAIETVSLAAVVKPPQKKREA